MKYILILIHLHKKTFVLLKNKQPNETYVNKKLLNNRAIPTLLQEIGIAPLFSKTRIHKDRNLIHL